MRLLQREARHRRVLACLISCDRLPAPAEAQSPEAIIECVSR